MLKAAFHFKILENWTHLQNLKHLASFTMNKAEHEHRGGQLHPPNKRYFTSLFVRRSEALIESCKMICWWAVLILNANYNEKKCYVNSWRPVW